VNPRPVRGRPGHGALVGLLADAGVVERYRIQRNRLGRFTLDFIIVWGEVLSAANGHG
jgi:hypothetical protein